MARWVIRKKYWIVALGILVLVTTLAAVIWRLTLGPRSDGTPQLPEPSAARLESITPIVKAVDLGVPIAIVQFRADREGTGVMPLHIPSKGPWKFNLNEQSFDIAGTFQVMTDLHLRFPRWGHVYDSVTMDQRWGRDEAERRLWPLLQAAEEGRPLPLLAIIGAGSKAPRAATFLGPLKPADLEHLPQLMEVLNKEPFDKISAARAASMTGAANPCVAYLGLARLRKLDAPDHYGRRPHLLMPVHFIRAMRCRTVEEVPLVLDEMFAEAVVGNERFRVEQAEHFTFRELGPSQQKKGLATLLAKYGGKGAPSRQATDWYIDLPRWQAAVRAYLPEARADPSRQEIVPLLEAVLKLK